jgi:hypothetical protein
VLQAELVQDVRDVRLGGRLGDHQRRGDLPVALALRDQPGDFLLAGGSAENRPRGRLWLERCVVCPFGEPPVVRLFR